MYKFLLVCLVLFGALVALIVWAVGFVPMLLAIPYGLYIKYIAGDDAIMESILSYSLAVLALFKWSIEETRREWSRP